jgi:hypothetical protein
VVDDAVLKGWFNLARFNVTVRDRFFVTVRRRRARLEPAFGGERGVFNAWFALLAGQDAE